jgi:signal transduction histidine kinase
MKKALLMTQDTLPPSSTTSAGGRTVEALERKVAILETLAEISTVLNSTYKLKPLLNALMDAAAKFTDSEAASVLLWDGTTDSLRFAATTTDDTGQNLIGKVVPLEGSIAGTVVRENRVVIVDNTNQDDRHNKSIDKGSGFQTHSILGVPMRSKNRVIGVLEAVNKRTLPWTRDDEYYLSVLAAQSAVAIEGAQLVTALQKANEDLKQVDKLKSDFIAIASHELRTPLGVILGYASFIQETEDPAVRGLADKVVNSAEQLRRIIEDLTNLRYLESKPNDLNYDSIPLQDILRDNLDDVRAVAEMKGHRLMVRMSEPMQVSVDRIRLNMALTNVLNNAIRFTQDNGTISVETERRGRELWIMVKDNGIGIEEKDLERIFERFVQVEDHMTRSKGGLGIGLSIARALIEAHGGRLWATSSGLNQGATFIIALPLNS